jgi:hypothetical protein
MGSWSWVIWNRMSSSSNHEQRRSNLSALVVPRTPAAGRWLQSRRSNSFASASLPLPTVPELLDSRSPSPFGMTPLGRALRRRCDPRLGPGYLALWRSLPAGRAALTRAGRDRSQPALRCRLPCGPLRRWIADAGSVAPRGPPVWACGGSAGGSALRRELGGALGDAVLVGDDAPVGTSANAGASDLSVGLKSTQDGEDPDAVGCGVLDGRGQSVVLAQQRLQPLGVHVTTAGELRCA